MAALVLLGGFQLGLNRPGPIRRVVLAGERAVAMHGHDGISLATSEHVVAAANADNSEARTLKKTQHILAADARELSHESVQSDQVRGLVPVDGYTR
jgi:hypothetical protein